MGTIFYFLFFILKMFGLKFHFSSNFFFFLNNSSTYNGPLCRSRFTLNPKPTLLVLILFCVVGRYQVPSCFSFSMHKDFEDFILGRYYTNFGVASWGVIKGTQYLVPTYLPTYLAVLSKVVFVFVSSLILGRGFL